MHQVQSHNKQYTGQHFFFFLFLGGGGVYVIDILHDKISFMSFVTD